MGKVLKVDASSADAWVEIDLGSPQSALFVTMEVRITGTALAHWETVTPTPQSGNFAVFFDASHSGNEALQVKDFGSGLRWADIWDNGSTPPVGDAYLLVEHQFTNGGADRVYIDSALEIDTTDGLLQDTTFIQIGQSSVQDTGAGQVIYIRSVKIGTTRGDDDLFSDDFEDGTLDAWTSTSGDVSVVDDPFPSEIQGFCVAFDPALEPNPTWIRLDDPDTDWRLRVAQVTIDRGVDAETDTVKTGTASITLRDPDGILDPTNTTSPFWDTGAGETMLNPNLQAAFARWNPVDETWSTRFRGFIRAIRHTMNTSGFSQVTLELVDGFEVLADLRLTPGNQGDTPRTESVGDIFYEGGSPVPADDVFKHVDQRIVQALDDAGWPGTGEFRNPAVLRDVFSGNVSVQEKVYARDGQLVAVISDAADAEFPDVSRACFSREGVFLFRGRFARFFPENPGYGIGNWELGGSDEAAADAAVVLLSDFTFRRSKEDIINVATALPKGLEDVDVPGNKVEDAASIAKYGRRPWMADNLLTWEGHDEDLDPTTAAEETLKFAQFKVANFKDPKTRIERVTVKSRHPDSFSGAAAWAFLNGVELGDLVHVETTHRGGGGFDEDYFVESIREVDEPLDGTMHMVTMTVDVSPRSFYAENPFGEVHVGVS